MKIKKEAGVGPSFEKKVLFATIGSSKMSI